jgi:hypothetical protein
MEWNPDTVYITSSIFSWCVPESISLIRQMKKKWPQAEIKVGGVMASLNPDYFEAETGIKPYVGILWEVEKYRPDYETFGWFGSSLVFTSRGCWVGCGFCPVPALEGKIIQPIKEWRTHIEELWPRLILQDNNIVGSPWKHFTEVMAYLRTHDFRIDLNSGIEPHGFQEKHAQEMASLNWRPIRTAFDEMNEETEFTRAMHLIRQYLTTQSGNIMVYVLFDYKDTPEDALYRCLKVVELGGSPWPMPYRPLNWFSKEQYVGPNWTLLQIKRFYRFWSRAPIWKHALTKHGPPSLKDIFEAKRACLKCFPEETPVLDSKPETKLTTNTLQEQSALARQPDAQPETLTRSEA